MIYRVVTLVGAVLFVVLLFCLLWFLCKQFLSRHNASGDLSDRAMVLATWTFAGISVGLVFAVVGAFLLGPWAFHRALKKQPDVGVSEGAAVWWGLGIVATSLFATVLVAVLVLYSVGALS